MEGPIPWIMLGATIAAAISAIAAAFTAYCNHKTIKSTREAIIASNLVNCSNAYTNVMRIRSKALTEKSKRLCEDYYRELFDLLWTEFQLWRKGMIPDNIISYWLSARHRDFTSTDKLLYTTEDGKEVAYSYKDAWGNYTEHFYYEPFLDLMNRAHTELLKDVKVVKKLRKKLQKNG